MSTQTLYVKSENKHLWEKLKLIADNKDRSVSYLVHKALEEYISREGD